MSWGGGARVALINPGLMILVLVFEMMVEVTTVADLGAVGGVGAGFFNSVDGGDG